MSQKMVKKITVAVGGQSYKLISGSPNAGGSVEDVNVTDFDDEDQVRLPHPQAAPGNIPLVIADDGDGVPPTIKTVAEYTFTTTYSDGFADSPKVKKIVGYLGSAEPATIEVGGERRPVWNCEFRKCGISGTTTTTAP